MPLSRPRLLLLGAALAAGLLSFGAKLMLVHENASDVPYMDEWDAVGRVLLLPSSHDNLHASDFLQPQNEHRVVLSRLISYALLRANRQWDGLLEMTVNAAIHAALCAAFILFARRLLVGARFTIATLLTTLLFVLAYDWENTLQGFQSQVYLLEWCAFAVCLLCVPSRPLSTVWWAGWLAGLAGLGTMSSGFMGPAAVLVVQAARSVFGRRPGRGDYVGAALLAALCAAGILAVAPVPGHLVLRAISPWQALVSACAALSWPEWDWPIAFLVLQLPLLLLALRRLRERAAAAEELVLMTLGLWAWMQVAAIAVARGNLGTYRSPRYTDLYAVAAFANVLALGRLWRPSPPGRPFALLGILWVCLFLCGLWSQEERALHFYLEDFRRAKPLERAHVRSFLETGDPRALTGAQVSELPYPRPEELAGWLSEPGIRQVLPVSVRPALGLVPDTDTNGFESSSSPERGGRSWVARRGPARFTSMPLPFGLLPFLRISVRGSAGLDMSAVRLEPSDGPGPGARIPLAGQAWLQRDLAVPSGAGIRLVADLPAGDGWIEFTEPVEIGWGSWADRWLIRRAAPLTSVAAVLFGMAITALLLLDHRHREP